MNMTHVVFLASFFFRLAVCLVVSCETIAAASATAAAFGTTTATAAAAATNGSFNITLLSTSALAQTTPGSFLAHGWEPWSATQTLTQLANGDTAVLQAFRTLLAGTGGSVRFGGISADFLRYVNDSQKLSGACEWNDHGGTFHNYECPFSIAMFDFLSGLRPYNGSGNGGVGIETLLFDLNELTGRNCTKPGPKKWQPNEYCGDHPNVWNTSAVQMLLEHFANTNKQRKKLGHVMFELGNELFLPPHIPRKTATADIATLMDIVSNTFSTADRPRVFGFGTNTCGNDDGRDMFAGLAKAGAHFSYHNYPGNSLKDAQGLHDLRTFLLNTTWLRTNATGRNGLCLEQWEEGGYKANGMHVVVTEAAAVSGHVKKGTPTTVDFIHTFFSIAELGQFALRGVDMVCRWSLTGGQGLVQTPQGHNEEWDAAADLFLYTLYNRTVGHGVLSVAEGTGKDPLVYAHCGLGGNGSITLLLANPNPNSVVLGSVLVDGVESRTSKVSLTPRMEYILTPDGGDINAHAPVLNGGMAGLKLSDAGALPEMPGKYTTGNQLSLPAYATGFVVLLEANVQACKQH